MRGNCVFTKGRFLAEELSPRTDRHGDAGLNMGVYILDKSEQISRNDPENQGIPAMFLTFDDPIFTDETAAREALEAIRWPSGPACVHCGATEHVSHVGSAKQTHRPGLFYCKDCKGQFTVTVGTVFERSKIPLTKRWMTTFMLCSSKKGISGHQFHRTLGVT